MIRYLTAGESHGQALTVILEGVPAGLKLDIDAITVDLRRRQMGYGRGARMRIEKDAAIVTSGLWQNKTIGSPITIFIQNKDWKNWRDKKSVRKLVPRPGHADLVGLLKYDFEDIQAVIERASARESAARTAAGAVAKQYLAHFGVKICSHTRQIGQAANCKSVKPTSAKIKMIERSPVRCADAKAAGAMIKYIDQAAKRKDTLGGVSEIIATGVPLGLGSYVQHDRRADAKLAAAVMSVQSVKAVELGEGIHAAGSLGSEVHDPIDYFSVKGFVHQSNNAGGIIGGVTTGENIILRAYFKPISTLGNPLSSVNLKTKKKKAAPYVRSDICIVPAGGVVCEAAVALALADLAAEKFGGDSIRETVLNYKTYRKYLSAR